MADFCAGGEGFGPWSTDRLLDLTPCFEETVLLSIPRLLLVIWAIIRSVKLAGRPSPMVPKGWLYWCKMVTTSTILALFVLQTTYIFIKHGLGQPFLIVSSAVDIPVTIIALVLTHMEHLRSRLSSSALLFYWLLVLIFNGVKINTYIQTDIVDTDPVLFGLIIAITFEALIVFGVENMSKPYTYYMSLDENVNVTPEETANIFSRLTFHWMDGLMKAGAKKDLEMDDLWMLKNIDSAKYNSETFQKYWNEQLALKNPSLFAAIYKTFGPTFMSAAIFKATQDALGFFQPQLLKYLMLFAKSWSPDTATFPQPMYRGFSIAILMLLTALCQTAVLHQYFHICFITGMRVRAAIVTAVYRKALRLSNNSRQSSTVGEIVNLMSVDAARIMDLTSYLHILWSGPFQICLALYFLYEALGPAIFAGVAVMLLMIPVNAWLATQAKKLGVIQMKNKDRRTKMMDEILNGIKVIKLYAWERSFLKKISGAREQELSTLRRIAYLAAASSFSWSATPFFVSFLSFSLYAVISDQPLTSDKVFVSLTLFNLLQFPLSMLPSVITSCIEASVSFGRLYKFLVNEELDNKAVVYETPPPSTKANSVERVAVKDGVFRWARTSNESNLTDISFNCKDGELLAIVGVVGAGKSSIVSALLGEMYKSSGSVIIRGSVAYVPQTPWIMNATLRDNILFGSRYEHDFYEETITACGLKPDLEMLPGNDLTEIGERGINLSGGQKARVALARAVYARADIYLVDDTLSSVDAHVGRSIFTSVLGPEGLLKDKARIFVTHSIQFLPECDHVMTVAGGRICELGSYASLIQEESCLRGLMRDYGKQHHVSEPASESNTPEQQRKAAPNGATTPFTAATTTTMPTTTVTAPVVENGAVMKAPIVINGTQLVQKETSASGSVSWDVYITYAKSCSLEAVILFLIMCIGTQSISIGMNLYLADWTRSNDSDSGGVSIGTRLAVYGGLGIASSFTVLLQVIFVVIFCGIRSARKLHSDMLLNVMRLPQQFFDVTPLGRILNRFSKDQYTVDEVLPRVFQGFFRTLFQVLAVLAVNAMISPYFIVFATPLGLLYLYFQQFYIRTSRELKRLDSVSRSPIYAHFSETLGGVSSIRAYKQEMRFQHSNEDRLDINQRAYYPSVSSNRWLAVRLETIGSLIVFGSALFTVLTIYITGHIDGSSVGLSLMYALSVTQTLNWMVRQSCEIETNIVSVERIKEYIDLKQEALYETKQDRSLPPHWPANGAIEFRNYSTRYREGLDLVLKDVTFSVKPQEKIGIVGRTGAGKSSLTLSLFRLVEAASGSIAIDGVDVSALGLGTLRSKLTIIPQDPVLFQGTVRDNLDPFVKHTDDEIWRALESASLKETVGRLELKLSAPVLQGGENWSVGQRQLLCLARALLRKTKILVLDEATASIDQETDSIIQKTIRKEFKDCTILVIAHRINTVMDNDRILVLDRGQVSEFDSPRNLLKNHRSKFYSLARESGLTSGSSK
ncbi:hypothetical protein SmJEL517_g05244 [Synchytrium microbalum]|uniref:Uncharacterized protein n=1 Tax=Synchytrium microbalum TaxID=1806994 RepID=A0A507BMC2_9FUNG|nr:uncharacterized protein SmJEL517_g05244 [Synchytrium microbalum]TPX31400.1 hypothetical protein SmJEL517_g05244 [Synchytrium microbalum]